MLVLRTLGSISLDCSERGGELLEILAQPKRLSLLAYLAVAEPRGFHRRDTLLNLFWPEMGESRARNALSQSLSFLRKNLAKGMVITRGTEEVELDLSDLTVDVVDFKKAVDDGRWADALEIYRGEFLRGFHLAGAQGFDDWAQVERDRLRAEAARCAWSLAQEQVRQGTLEEGERSAKRAMRLDCPDETTVSRFIGDLIAAGDRVAALRVYHDFTEVLGRTLEIGPTEELEAVALGLRTGVASESHAGEIWKGSSDSPLIGRAPRSVLPPEEPESEFAGRTPELLRLGGFLDRALQGQGAVAFLTGESGTGKTVLAREFCRQWAETNPDLVWAAGHCDANTGSGDPYHPFREIFNILTGDVESHWLAGTISPDRATRLWRLIPVSADAILEFGPDLLDVLVTSRRLAARVQDFDGEGVDWEGRFSSVRKAGDDVPPMEQRSTLFEQCARVLRRIAQNRPLVLLLEDLQWADSASIDLLFHLGRHLEGAKILILGTFRPSEVGFGRAGGRHPLDKVVNELKSSFGEIEVFLRESGDRSFFDSLVDSEPNDFHEAFREALFEATQGHALFTVELIRVLQDEGRISEGDDGRWVAEPKLHLERLPARIEAVIEERLARLSRRLRDVLDIASVEGEHFTLEVVARVLGEDPSNLLRSVSGDLEKRHRLVRIKGVQRRGGLRLSIFSFRHALFQRFLYDRLDSAERAYLHEQVARAMAEVFGAQSERKALPLARHFREAGAYMEAIRFLRIAAERAKERGAYPESFRLLEEARSLVSRIPNSTVRDRLELGVLSSLGILSWVLGISIDDPEGLLARTRELAAVLEDDDRMYWALGCTFTRQFFLGKPEEGERTLKELQAVVGRSEDAGKRLQQHTWLGFNALHRGFPREALAHLDKVESTFDPDVHQAVMSFWLKKPMPFVRSLKALALGPMGFPDSAANCVREAYQLLEGTQDATALLHVGIHDVLLRLLCCDPRGVGSENEVFDDIVERTGPGGWGAVCRFASGWCTANREDPSAGAAMMEQALRTLDDNNWSCWRPYLQALHADTLGMLGQASRALEQVESSLARIESTGERFQEPEVNRIKGNLLLLLPTPDIQGAEASYRRAVAIAHRQETRLFELRASVGLARLLRDQDRVREARAVLKKPYSFLMEGFDFPDPAEAGTLLLEMA